MPPLRIGLSFFIDVSHRGLHLSRGDKYLTPVLARPAAVTRSLIRPPIVLPILRPLAAIIADRGGRHAIYRVKQSLRSTLLRRCVVPVEERMRLEQSAKREFSNLSDLRFSGGV